MTDFTLTAVCSSPPQPTSTCLCTPLSLSHHSCCVKHMSPHTPHPPAYLHMPLHPLEPVPPQLLCEAHELRGGQQLTPGGHSACHVVCTGTWQRYHGSEKAVKKPKVLKPMKLVCMLCMAVLAPKVSIEVVYTLSHAGGTK